MSTHKNLSVVILSGAKNPAGYSQSLHGSCLQVDSSLRSE